MRLNYKFSNLLGVVYKEGDLVFSPDGGSLLAPVGNRVSRYELAGRSDGSSLTSGWETIAGQIQVLCISPDGRLQFAVDEGGKAVLAATHGSQILLGRLNLHGGKVSRAAFSPDSSRLAICIGRLVQVWRVPLAGSKRRWLTFELDKTMSAAGSSDEISALAWSPCGKFIATGSPDMALRVLRLDGAPKGSKPMEATGHRHTIVGVHWVGSGRVLSVSREGVLKSWSITENQQLELLDSRQLRLQQEADDVKMDEEPSLIKTKKVHEAPVESRPWISSLAWHPNLLLIGYINGVFAVFALDAELASCPIYALSIGKYQIDSCAINKTGEWLAFGCRETGQLLVWEWRSEAYVLKQQGHLSPMASVQFSPDGQSIATGGQDGRVKVWGASTGFAHVTFAEHRGAITALHWVRQSGGNSNQKSSVLLSASTDGTVRAWDLLRCKAFRLLTTPLPAQFSCLAVDPTGDVVVAGTLDTFQIHVWSLRTGDLLETIDGHTGPISCLSFDPIGRLLVSGSWDKTVRSWDLFARDRKPRLPWQHSHEVLSLAYRPDGKEVAVACLNGDLAFWDPLMDQQVGQIEAKRDIHTRKLDGHHFSSCQYSTDGRAIWASGTFPWMAVYSSEGPHRLLLARLPFSQLHRSKDADRINDNPAKKLDHQTILSVSPTGRALACLTKGGCQLWNLEEGLLFDPTDLDCQCTPEAAMRYSRQGHHLHALLMSFRLGQPALSLTIWSAIQQPAQVIDSLPTRYVPAVLNLLASLLASPQSRAIEAVLTWVCACLKKHSLWVRSTNRTASGLAPALRAIHKALHQARLEYGALANDNLYQLQLLSFLSQQ